MTPTTYYYPSRCACGRTSTTTTTSDGTPLCPCGQMQPEASEMQLTGEGDVWRLECHGEALAAYRRLSPYCLDDLAEVDPDGCTGTEAQCRRVYAAVLAEMDDA